jgi:glycosyltransferase involved in cell wall biosynthesis
MKILFVHQSFPGQFKHLAPALVTRGNDVAAFSIGNKKPHEWRGVKIFTYPISRGNTPGIHPWIGDFESKVIRGEAAFRHALAMKENGFYPDVIIAHPGWGESLFLKEVWPKAQLGIYCEFHYHPTGNDVGFDPEFPAKDPADSCRVLLKNTNNLLHFEIADGGVSPTHWQASTFPLPFRDKITVVHDGIDTEAIAPNGKVNLTLNSQLQMDKSHEIVTFVNRNLEPYRGYHIFMRALPTLLRERPNVRVMIVGGNDVSYGAPPKNGQSWREMFIHEVRPLISDADWQRVHFLGTIPYPTFIGLLQLSSVHVYLTYPFVLSWSLLESMSAGCAIVASDTQPLHEAIEHGNTGMLVDFFDSNALARQIADLLGNQEEREKLGRNARDFARANYDLRKICLPRQIAWIESLR